VTYEPSDQESVTDLPCDAWIAQYDRYSVRVWRYVARVIGSDSEAVGDAVQETFLAAARAFHQYDPERGTPWAWLSGIAHRQVVLHWRRIGRDRIDRVGAPVEEAVVDDEVSARLDQVETAEIVRAVLAAMSAESAAILQGKYCDAQTVAELVEQFGGTTEGIRSKLARARRDFKKRYEKADDETPAPASLKKLNKDRT
jgi:RNA polymerase sigma-70 factor (ECF subfamily)